MGVASRGKRRIVVAGRIYWWYVGEDLEAAGMVALNVLSDDKQFIVQYYVAEPDSTRHVVVIGREFAGSVRSSSRWQRYRCPRFGSPTSIAPSDVRAFIEWCQNEGSDSVQVDWRGHELEPERGS